MGINRQQSGFTIIEVMLFLAVSAALGTAIFVGSGVAIGNQRYRDALNSFQSHIQQQYNEVANVVNTRGDDQSCTSAAPTHRGMSNCYIVGRVMTIQENKDIAVSNVRGEISSAAEQDLKNRSSDLEALNAYTYTIDTSTTESSELAWGATLTGVSDPFTILILRSPLSGTIRTFTYEGNIINEGGVLQKELDSESALSAEYMQERLLCLDQAAFTTSPQLGVMIRAGAAGANGVELTTDTGMCNAAA